MSAKPFGLTDIMTDLTRGILPFLLEITLNITCSFVKK